MEDFPWFFSIIHLFLTNIFKKNIFPISRVKKHILRIYTKKFY